MATSIDGLTDRAYMTLRENYGSDKAVWTAVAAVRGIIHFDGADCLRELCKAHKIDPDRE